MPSEESVVKGLEDVPDEICASYIAQFVRVSAPVVYAWKRGDSFPVGLNLLRLCYALHLLNLAGLRRTDGKELAFIDAMVYSDISTFSDVNIGVSNDYISRAVKRGTSFSDDVLAKATDFIAKNEAVVNERKTLFALMAKEVRSPKTQGTTTSVKRQDGIAPEQVGGMVSVNEMTNDKLISSLAHLILALQPVADVAVSDRLSLEEREQLRSLCGPRTIFDVKNLLTALCGEQARNNFLKERKCLT